MINSIYSVYDAKIKAHVQPFFARSAGEAQRMLLAAARDPQTTLAQYPKDFTLFEHGEFDDGSGLITPHKVPLPLGSVEELIQADNRRNFPAAEASDPDQRHLELLS